MWEVEFPLVQGWAWNHDNSWVWMVLGFTLLKSITNPFLRNVWVVIPFLMPIFVSLKIIPYHSDI